MVVPGQFVHPPAALSVHWVEFLEAVLVLLAAHQLRELFFDVAEEVGVLLGGGPNLARVDDWIRHEGGSRVGGGGGPESRFALQEGAVDCAGSSPRVRIELLPLEEFFARVLDCLNSAVARNFDFGAARRALLLEREFLARGAVIDVALGIASVAARELLIAASLAELLGCVSGAASAVAGARARVAAVGKRLAADLAARNRFRVRAALHSHRPDVATGARALDDFAARRALAQVARVLSVVVPARPLARAGLVARRKLRTARKGRGEVLGAAAAAEILQNPVRARRARAGVAHGVAGVAAHELTAARFLAAVSSDGVRIGVAAVRAADCLARVAAAAHRGAASLVADHVLGFEAPDLLGVVAARTRRDALDGAPGAGALVAQLFAFVQSARKNFTAAIVARWNWILATFALDVGWEGRFAAGATCHDGRIGRARRTVRSGVTEEVAFAVPAALCPSADGFAAEALASARNFLHDLCTVACDLNFDVALFTRPVVALGFAVMVPAIQQLSARVVANFLRIGRSARV